MSGVRRCDGKQQVCDALDARLGESSAKGMVVFPVYNMKTGKAADSLIVYKTTASDRGLVLNFCPFCGQKLNRRVAWKGDATEVAA